MTVAIKVSRISKTFTSQSKGLVIRALQDINLEVYSGEILGVLGPNGAGKTTFLNILSSLLLADAGTVEIFGIKLIPKNFYYLRRLLNMSSGHPNFPWSLTVRENLKFYGRLYGRRGEDLNKKADELMAVFNLGQAADQRFDELSSGTKQKLSLAKALLNDPKIIFLDEPTVGLDPDVAIHTREFIHHIHKNLKLTVLLTTHNMQEAEAMCQRIAFLKEGRLLRLATPQELKSTQGKKDLEEVFVALVNQKDGAVNKNEPPASKKIFLETAPPRETAELLSEGPLLAAANWFNRCFAFSYRNFLFAIRNLFAFMELIFWPVVSLFSIGLLGNYLVLQEKAAAFVMTGAITAGILQVSQLDVAYSLLYEVWSKSVKHTLLTPVGMSEQLIGSWIIGVARGLAIFFILGISAMRLFEFRFPGLGVMLVVLLGIFGCALLLGALVTFLILVFGQKAEISAWMFAYLFMLLCGIYYPIDTLPKIFFLLAQFFPLTYFLEYFRQAFGFKPLLGYGLLKGFGLIVLYLLLGFKMLQYALTKAREKGVIVRLSE